MKRTLIESSKLIRPTPICIDGYDGLIFPPKSWDEFNRHYGKINFPSYKEKNNYEKKYNSVNDTTFKNSKRN